MIDPFQRIFASLVENLTQFKPDGRFLVLSDMEKDVMGQFRFCFGLVVFCWFFGAGLALAEDAGLPRLGSDVVRAELWSSTEMSDLYNVRHDNVAAGYQVRSGQAANGATITRGRVAVRRDFAPHTAPGRAWGGPGITDRQPVESRGFIVGVTLAF
ncbi:MAG: hypothetical protein AAFW87_11380 [Pseudomonadota bacterium]